MQTITPFAFSGLLAGIFSFSFGLLVLLKSPNKKLARIWALFALSTTAWGFGCFWIGTTTNADAALLAWRVTYSLSIVWMPSLFFHFVCVFCELKRPKILFLHYAFSTIYCLLLPTENLFTSTHLMFGSLYFTRNAWPYLLFVTWWLAFIIYSHFELWKAYKQGSAIKKKQIKYFFLATAIGYLGGSLVYLPHFGIELYPWGNFTVFLYPIIMSYAMIQFNLMDIRILARRTALIIGVYLGLIFVSSPILYLFHEGQYSISGTGQVLEILLISGILSAGPFLYAYFVRRSAYFQEYTVAGIAHELKSPLAIIESALDFLSNTPDPKSLNADQLSSYLQMIQRNATRLQCFTNNLLQAFNNTHDKTLSKENVDLVNLIEEIIASYKPLAEFKKIDLRVESPQSPLFISCDSKKIEQVISNLLSNALKFSDRGKISIETRTSPKEIQFSIIDQGAGIPNDELPHIFDRFYQGNIGRSRKGTGLGLTIAQLWIEAHGGRIWAESNGTGNGTQVNFTLPLKR